MMDDVKYMIGFNTHEGTLFAFLSFLVYRDITPDFYASIIRSSFPGIAEDVLRKYPAEKHAVVKDVLVEVITDAYFLQYIKTFATTASATGKTVYFYEFSHSPVVTLTGLVGLNATHAEEINSIFRNRAFGNLDDDNLSATMRNYWIAFAHSGNPNTWIEGEPTIPWPSYTAPTYEGINFHLPITIVQNVRDDYVKFWRTHFPHGLDINAERSWFDDEPLISYMMNVGVIRAFVFFRRKMYTVIGCVLLLTLLFIYRCCGGRSRKIQTEKKIQ